MTRNLQITIFEGGAPRRRSVRAGRPGGPGSDPGDDYVMPPPGDPGDDYVMPPPGDPGDDYVMPPPGDPGDDYVMPPPGDPGDDYVMPPPGDPGDDYVMPPPGSPSAGYPGFVPGYGPAGAFVAARYLSGAAPAQVCCCKPCPDGKAEPPSKFGVSERDYSGFVIVRLAPGVEPLTKDSLWEIAEAADLHGLQSVLELSLDEEEEDRDAPAGEQADARGREARGGRGPGREESESAPSPGRGKRFWRKEWREEPPEKRPSEPAGTLVSRPLVQLRGRDRKSTVWAIQTLEQKAAQSSFRPRHSLARYWRVDLRPYPELVGEVLAAFNALAAVDLAYREVRAIDTSFHMGEVSGGALAEDQSYFDPAPVGIGARWLKQQIASDAKQKAEKVTVIDLEQGWNLDHEQFPALAQKGSALFVFGENRQDDEPGAGNHGTAVLGQIAAAGTGDFGVRGAAVELAEFYVASHYRRQLKPNEPPTLANPFPGTNGHVAAAIVNCLIGPASSPSPLGTGDVLLLEIQRGRLPTEIDEADLDAIRLASAAGIVVVEAAGNGNFNLDRCVDPQTGRTLQRGAAGFVDSGAILVGASFSALPHDRAPFSNYGSRVDCYGWGEGVTTCGYGDLSGASTADFYTNTFNGTSSAAPIIAGAAALLQCLHRLRTGNPLLPAAMRSLLASRASGTPQGPNVGGHIGVMPNLDVISRGALQLVPDVYLRRSVCDDGGTLGPGEELSSSPDILISTMNAAALGEGSHTVNDPAPGDWALLGDTSGRQVFARLRNRGRSMTRRWVRLFASPAATLILPERWVDLEAVRVAGVPTGDTLAVSDPPLPWTPPSWAPPQSWPPNVLTSPAEYPAFSYLAVVEDDEAAEQWDAYEASKQPPRPSSPLPPGGPYFRWAAWRAFLRRSGVAWRNSHRVPATVRKLGFLVAGTLDREREFDLEVIQRLPGGARVDWVLPSGLAAKLAQRQPALASTTPGTLSLPERRLTRFSRVRLPKGLCAPARFDLTATTTDPLGNGHSLAIRQLWRGEEVGRITWHFGL
jgi:hypothetical protein